MIDTIKLKVDINHIDGNTLDQLKEHHQTKIYNKKLGSTTYSGSLENLKLYLSPSGLNITGSLAKYYYGDNDRSLDRNSVKLALERIADNLDISLDKCIVTRLDLAQNIIVDRVPNDYYKMLGNDNYYQRLEMQSGLNYRNEQREIALYDKQLEMKQRKAKICPELVGVNVLRYEFRMKNNKSICRNLSLDRITANDLYEPTIYQKMILVWGSEFDAIEKYTNTIEFADEIYCKPKQFCAQITYQGVQAIGGYVKIREMISVAYKRGAFKTQDQYSALKRKIKQLNQLHNLAVDNNLVYELESKVREIVLNVA